MLVKSSVMAERYSASQRHGNLPRMPALVSAYLLLKYITCRNFRYVMVNSLALWAPSLIGRTATRMEGLLSIHIPWGGLWGPPFFRFQWREVVCVAANL